MSKCRFDSLDSVGVYLDATALNCFYVSTRRLESYEEQWVAYNLDLAKLPAYFYLNSRSMLCLSRPFYELDGGLNPIRTERFRVSQEIDGEC